MLVGCVESAGWTGGKHNGKVGTIVYSRSCTIAIASKPAVATQQSAMPLSYTLAYCPIVQAQADEEARYA